MATAVLAVALLVAVCLLVTSGLDFDTLNYFALGFLFFVIITSFYGIIAIFMMCRTKSQNAVPSASRRYMRGRLDKAFLRSASSGRSLATTLCVCLELGSV